MPKKPEILETRSIARSKLFHVQQVDLRFSNGEEREYERLLSSGRGVVMMAPIREDGCVLLVREYSVGIEAYALFLPKGLVDKGEKPIDAANRELMEEIGFGAGKLEWLRRLTTTAGHAGSWTEVFLARELYAKRLPGDEPEELEVVAWPLSDLSGLFEHPEMHDARSIAALLLVRDLLDLKK